jgi:hypothetical protein
MINKDLIFIDHNGFYFGIFPKTMIDELDTDLDIEIRMSAFGRFKKAFEENIDNQDFLKYISTFFTYVLKFTRDKVSTIVLQSLQIINDLLTTIPGVSIITNIHSSIPILLDNLGDSNLQVREETKAIFLKIMMIIPTSQLLPYMIKELGNINWIEVYEIVNLLTYMFKEIKSIYNDIDFADFSFDDLIFVEIIKLMAHDTPKV